MKRFRLLSIVDAVAASTFGGCLRICSGLAALVVG
jgi:hypothetical protein